MKQYILVENVEFGNGLMETFAMNSGNYNMCWKITLNNSFAPSFRISGNAASDKNIKEGVCTQIEKNFVKDKWKVVLLILISIACS